MTNRREFSVALQIAIQTRARDSSWRIHCEGCGKWCAKRADYHIDHVIPEGMLADKARALVAADGQLLCVDCHDIKTDKDKAAIGLAKRREAYHLGIEKPGKKKLRTRPRKERQPYRPAVGQSQVARRYV
jgi:HNH endonuclease